MQPKYGSLLTDEVWPGLPLRTGSFSGHGALESLHADADTLLVWSGGASRVSIRAGGARHELRRQSGMVDLLPAGIALERIEWQGEPTACISAVLAPARVEELLGAEPVRIDPERGLRLGVTDAHVVDLVRRLEEQASAGPIWGPLYVESLSLTLASYVYARYAGERGTERGAGALSRSECQRLIDFIDAHLESSVSLSALAALSGYSPDHFSRLFKRSFGVSPHQYVLDRRVERAKALLQDRRHSILEVALACGFASQAHLNAVFKRRTGVTPGAYRKG